ncbi:MAG TPA: hypothetical protein VIX19_08845 [Terriglobales bacterium]
MKAYLGLLLALLAGGSTFGQTSDCVSLTHQALEVSGVNQSMDAASQVAASDTFLTQIALPLSAVPSISGADLKTTEFRSTLKAIVLRHLNGELLRNELEARMASRCNPEQMSQTIQALQSPLVVRMLALEAEASTPEGREKRQRYVRVISIAPPQDSRVDAITALDSSAGITDFSASTVIAMTRGLLTGAEVNPDLVAELENHRHEMTEQMRNPTQVELLSTYRTASVADLVQYGKVCKSDPLNSFYGAVQGILLEIVEEQAWFVGRDVKAAAAAQLASRGKNP